VSFARWVHLNKRRVDPQRQRWNIESIGVMHFWIMREFSQEHEPDCAFAESVLYGATRIVKAKPFPVPSERCRFCEDHACRPDVPSPGTTAAEACAKPHKD
jgi:hypothetical protein